MKCPLTFMTKVCRWSLISKHQYICTSLNFTLAQDVKSKTMQQINDILITRFFRKHVINKALIYTWNVMKVETRSIETSCLLWRLDEYCDKLKLLDVLRKGVHVPSSQIWNSVWLNNFSRTKFAKHFPANTSSMGLWSSLKHVQEHVFEFVIFNLC